MTQSNTSASPTCSHMAVSSPLSYSRPPVLAYWPPEGSDSSNCRTGDNRCEQGGGKWRWGTQSEHKPLVPPNISLHSPKTTESLPSLLRWGCHYAVHTCLLTVGDRPACFRYLHSQNLGLGQHMSSRRKESERKVG